jgi:hypothetical protein
LFVGLKLLLLAAAIAELWKMFLTNKPIRTKTTEGAPLPPSLSSLNREVQQRLWRK